MKKSVANILISVVIAAVIIFAVFYFTLPAINLQNPGFWIFIAFSIICFGIVYAIVSNRDVSFIKRRLKQPKNPLPKGKGFKVFLCAIAIPIAVFLIGALGSSELFNAQRYAAVIDVPEAVFETDMPETAVVNNIALMDTETAQKMGARTLGALSDVVSQYEINEVYKQINYKRTPQKIATLEYADFFKWITNKSKGIPGYVIVDPVNVTEAKYEKLEKPIKYSESAFFGEDLTRKLRMSYPTKIFGSMSFEIDDDGSPYYIVSCMRPKVFLFGAMDVSEVIIFDPISGESNIYSVQDTPAWVDNVFTGDLASEKYDWHGTLKNGFFNSIIGNRDCKVTTDDFGYIVIEDDVWFFTGVTSVTSDKSNIGFIISNARTGEYKFYPVMGAEEYSAMRAAEGEVQEKGYVASFPSLINVSGQATYIMVLKDSGGLVKLYALVNVEKVGIVATGATQTEAKQEYVKLLRTHNIAVGDENQNDAVPEVTVTVKDIRIVTIGGNSVIYITAENEENLYKAEISADERVMLINNGDKLKIAYDESGIENIRNIYKWEFSGE